MPHDQHPAPARASAGARDDGADSTGRTGRGAADASPDEVQRRIGAHLAELAERLDPDAFTLFLKMMSGLNQAFARRNSCVDIPMTPEERALCTPELQQELIRLLEKSGIPAEHVADGLPAAGEDGARYGPLPRQRT